MVTRNYKLSKPNLGQVKSARISENFQENYEENLINYDILLGPSYGICIYDINNTAVICASKMGLKLPQKIKYSNLQITGLEKNIKQTEEEIKLKGFELERLE